MSDTTAVLAEVTEQIERLRKWPNTSNLIAAWKDYASLARHGGPLLASVPIEGPMPTSGF